MLDIMVILNINIYVINVNLIIKLLDIEFSLFKFRLACDKI